MKPKDKVTFKQLEEITGITANTISITVKEMQKAIQLSETQRGGEPTER